MKGSGSRFQVSVQGSVFGGCSGFTIWGSGFRVDASEFGFSGEGLRF